jgi:hypothetical protein
MTLLHVDANILVFSNFQLKSLAPADFATNTRQPPSQDITGDKEEVHSSGNKEEMVADVEDSARKVKEKVADFPKSTKKRGGGMSRGTGGKSLDSCRFEGQRHAELETPSEDTGTISMPKSM